MDKNVEFPVILALFVVLCLRLIAECADHMTAVLVTLPGATKLRYLLNYSFFTFRFSNWLL